MNHLNQSNTRPESNGTTQPDITPDQEIPNLQNAPPDVLLEIMAYLEWHDLLRLRQVCTSLNLSTRARALWASLVRSTPSRFLLTTRIAVASTTELERAFLRYQHVQRSWAGSALGAGLGGLGAPPRRRYKHIDLGAYDFANGRVLPGGRWFIKQAQNGEVVYTDLDLDMGIDIDIDMPTDAAAPPQRVWHRLIPPRPPAVLDARDQRRFDNLKLTVDVDAGAEYLTFNVLAVSLAKPRTGDYKYHTHQHTHDHTMTVLPIQFEVWRVTADFDAGGRVSGLASRRVSMFEIGDLDVTLISVFMCLRGDYFACCASVYDAMHDTQLVVYNWRAAAAAAHDSTSIDDRAAPRLCIPLHPAGPAGFPTIQLQSIHIIPHRRILCKYGPDEPQWRMASWNDSSTWNSSLTRNSSLTWNNSESTLSTTTAEATLSSSPPPNVVLIPPSAIIRPVFHAASLAICVCPPCTDDNADVVSFTAVDAHRQPLHVAFRHPTPNVEVNVQAAAVSVSLSRLDWNAIFPRSNNNVDVPPPLTALGLSARVRAGGVDVGQRYLHIGRSSDRMGVNTGAYTRDETTGAVYLCLYAWGDIPLAVLSKAPGPEGDADWMLDDVSGRCILFRGCVVEFE